MLTFSSVILGALAVTLILNHDNARQEMNALCIYSVAVIMYITLDV
jgi:hypothetical protein